MVSRISKKMADPCYRFKTTLKHSYNVQAILKYSTLLRFWIAYKPAGSLFIALKPLWSLQGSWKSLWSLQGFWKSFWSLLGSWKPWNLVISVLVSVFKVSPLQNFEVSQVVSELKCDILHSNKICFHTVFKKLYKEIIFLLF